MLNKPIGSSVMLDEDFVPGARHIIISRKKKWCINHEGNKALNEIIKSRLEEYCVAECNKGKKSDIIIEILDQVHSGDLSEGFIKHDPLTGRFFAVEAASGKNSLETSKKGDSPHKTSRELTTFLLFHCS